MGLPTHLSSAVPAPAARRADGWKRLLAVLLVTAWLSAAPWHGLDGVEALADGVSWLRYHTTRLPKDPHARALALIERFPIVDTHIDLPILVRYAFANQVAEVDLNQPTRGQVDIPRLRLGGVGGFMWSVFVGCPEDAGFPKDNDGNFTQSTWRVRDTLEQIDVAKLLIAKHSDTFELVATAKEWKKATRKGKIASMLGVEGGHQLGSTLSTIRAYYELGVRYVTLTHTCHNALADSCGSQGNPIQDRWGGISPFGRVAIKEMNRLGMIVDISHTSPASASDALSYSLAPPIFSHSNARGVHGAVRNIPDTILRRIGAISKDRRQNRALRLDGEGGQGWGNETGEADKVVPSGDALISLNFGPGFISEWDDGSAEGVRATVALLADHADYMGDLAGREHIGIGSDFDGLLSLPEGLEDVSKYANLIAELIRRGWTDGEIAGLNGGNLLRILGKVEAVAHKLRHAPPETAIFSGRTDLPMREF